MVNPALPFPLLFVQVINSVHSWDGELGSSKGKSQRHRKKTLNLRLRVQDMEKRANMNREKLVGFRNKEETQNMLTAKTFPRTKYERHVLYHIPFMTRYICQNSRTRITGYCNGQGRPFICQNSRTRITGYCNGQGRPFNWRQFELMFIISYIAYEWKVNNA